MSFACYFTEFNVNLKSNSIRMMRKPWLYIINNWSSVIFEMATFWKWKLLCSSLLNVSRALPVDTESFNGKSEVCSIITCLFTEPLNQANKKGPSEAETLNFRLRMFYEIAINFSASQVTWVAKLSFMSPPTLQSKQNKQKQQQSTQVNSVYQLDDEKVDNEATLLPRISCVLCNAFKQRLLFLLLYDFTIYCYLAAVQHSILCEGEPLLFSRCLWVNPKVDRQFTTRSMKLKPVAHLTRPNQKTNR